MNINELIQNDPKFYRFMSNQIRSIYFWYDYDNIFLQRSILKTFQNRRYKFSLEPMKKRYTKQYQIELDKLNEIFLNLFEIDS